MHFAFSIMKSGAGPEPDHEKIVSWLEEAATVQGNNSL